jgi:hypothetical protein
MNFGQAIFVYVPKYATFRGRACRPESWWFFQFRFWACSFLHPDGVPPGADAAPLLLRLRTHFALCMPDKACFLEPRRSFCRNKTTQRS